MLREGTILAKGVDAFRLLDDVLYEFSDAIKPRITITQNGYLFENIKLDMLSWIELESKLETLGVANLFRFCY